MSDEPEIRYLGDVQRLCLKPGDTVVLKVPERTPAAALERLSDEA